MTPPITRVGMPMLLLAVACSGELPTNEAEAPIEISEALSGGTPYDWPKSGGVKVHLTGPQGESDQCSAMMINNLWAASCFHCLVTYLAGVGALWTQVSSSPIWGGEWAPASGMTYEIYSGGSGFNPGPFNPTSKYKIRRMYKPPMSEPCVAGDNCLDIALLELETPWMALSSPPRNNDWQQPFWPLATSQMHGLPVQCLGWGGTASNYMQGAFFTVSINQGYTPMVGQNGVDYGDALALIPQNPAAVPVGGDSGMGCVNTSTGLQYQLGIHRGVWSDGQYVQLSTADSDSSAVRPGVRQWVDHILHHPPFDHGRAIKAPPGVASQAQNSLDLFWIRDSDARMIWTPFRGTWQGDVDLGKPTNLTLATSRVGADSWSSGRIDVFAQTTNNELWQRYAVGGTFQSGWFKMTDATTSVTSGPAVVSWAPERLDIFARGPNGETRHAYYQSGWGHVWESLEGIMTNDPAAASWGPARLDVVVRGENGRFYHKWYQGSWGPCQQGCAWEDLGGNFVGSPAVTAYKPGRLDVYGKSAVTGNLMHRWYEGYWLNEWIDTGIPIPDAPSGVSWGPGRVDLFTRTSTKSIWQTWLRTY